MRNVAPGVAGLAMGEMPIPDPGPGMLRVRVRAAALAFPDLLMLDDLYQVKRERPFVPGMEAAGEVDAVGPGVAGFKAGDRVFGFTPDGSLSDYAIVPAALAVAMPDMMSFVDAAGFTSGYATAFHALRQRARIRAGESLLVLSAAGGLGLATVQLGRAFGARVIAAASSADKVALAKAHGAEDGAVYALEPSQEDSRAFGAALKALAPDGIDVVADIVGGAYTEPAVRALGWEGRLLVLGFPAGIPRIAANLLLLKGAQAMGVFCGLFTQREPEAARRNLAELVDLYVDGAIRPYVSLQLPVERAGEGLAMLGRREVMGKLVVTLG